jgi:hypothetical protein
MCGERTCGARIVPARARPVPFWFQGLRPPPLTSRRVFALCVPCSRQQPNRLQELATYLHQLQHVHVAPSSCGSAHLESCQVGRAANSMPAMTCINQKYHLAAERCHLLPLGQLPAHDPVQDVSPHVHIKHGAGQRGVPDHIARPVAQRHLCVSQQPCRCHKQGSHC